MKATRARNIWICVCAAFFFALHATQGWGAGQVWLWWLLGLTAAVIVLVKTIVGPLWARSAWVCVGIATASFVAADIIYAIDGRPDNLLGSQSMEAVEDVLYGLTFLLLICASVILVNQRRGSVSDVSAGLDSAIVLVAAGMTAAEYLIYPLSNSDRLTGGQSAVFFTFEVLNLFLLATTARLWFASDRSVNRSVRYLAVGTIVLVGGVATSLAGWLPTTDGSSPGAAAAIQLTGFIFFAITGFSVLDPTAVRPPAADVDAGITSRSRVLAVLALCSLVPPVLLLLPYGDDGFTGSRPFVFMTLVLTVLLALRVNMLIQGFRDAVRREHLLREINAGLMRANDIADVNSRLDDWAARLVEQPDVICLHGTFDELAAIGVGALGAQLRNAKGQLRYRTVVTVPGTRPQRRLVIETPDIISSPAQASLAVLGQSVGMALERLVLSRRVVEREAAERLQLLLHNASDVIALVDNNGQIGYVTEAIRDLTNRSPTSIAGMQWTALFQDTALAHSLLDRARKQDEARGDLVINPAAVKLEADQTGDSQRARRLEVNVVWLRTEAQFVVTHHDVTDRYVLEQQLAFQAFHDELTGLNNRAVFRSELTRAAARSRRSLTTFAVMMIDLDDFKGINDTLGHPAGDELLRVVADRLVDCMREGDTPVRLGGDEFAVILESARSAGDAEAVGRRLLRSLSDPVTLLGTEVIIGASIGIAVSDGSAAAADVERDADLALYDAKFAGKNRMAVFRSDMHESAVRKMSLTNQLRVALEQNEIIVRYQPVIEMSTGGIAGAEALVRWKHPTRGELPPDVFIPLAEESGSIIEIGRYVITRALADLAAWTKQYPKHAASRVSINISGRQLQGDEIANALASSMAEAGIAANRVIIEVTESVLLPDDGAAAAQLKSISDLGVSVYLDDFGTGWASLHYLRSLPISGVKLAKEFVAGLPDEFDTGLARAIMELANSMKFEEVVAEGVETIYQRQALVNMGYRLGQGYLMARPELVDRFGSLLAIAPPAQWNLTQPGPRQPAANGGSSVPRVEPGTSGPAGPVERISLPPLA